MVLYALGGYAAAPGVRDTPWRSIAISLAGPAAGFVLFGLVYFVARVGLVSDGELPRRLVSDLLFINLVWGLVNLAPVWPLDGGRVSREVAMMLFKPSNGIVVSLGLSTLTAAALAAYAWHATGSLWNTALFGILAYESYQALSHYRASRGRW